MTVEHLALKHSWTFLLCSTMSAAVQLYAVKKVYQSLLNLVSFTFFILCMPPPSQTGRQKHVLNLSIRSSVCSFVYLFVCLLP